MSDLFPGKGEQTLGSVVEVPVEHPDGIVPARNIFLYHQVRMCRVFQGVVFLQQLGFGVDDEHFLPADFHQLRAVDRFEHDGKLGAGNKVQHVLARCGKCGFRRRHAMFFREVVHPFLAADFAYQFGTHLGKQKLFTEGSGMVRDK